MKTLLFCLMLLSTGLSAQLAHKHDTVNVSDELINIKLNLKKFRNQHRVGVWVTTIGAGLVFTGFAISGNSDPSAFYFVGGIMVFSGWCVRTNSFRFLDRAALSIGPTGGKVTYRFK